MVCFTKLAESLRTSVVQLRRPEYEVVPDGAPIEQISGSSNPFEEAAREAERAAANWPHPGADSSGEGSAPQSSSSTDHPRVHRDSALTQARELYEGVLSAPDVDWRAKLDQMAREREGSAVLSNREEEARAVLRTKKKHKSLKSSLRSKSQL